MDGNKKFASRNRGTISERTVAKNHLIISGGSMEGSSISRTVKPPHNVTLTLSHPPQNPSSPQQFYQTSLQYIFSAMGMNRDQCSKCFRQIDAQITAGQHKAITSQTFLPVGAVKQIKKLRDEAENALKQQKGAEAATKIQSLMRGFLFRKILSTYNLEARDRLKLWTGGFNQMLLLENRYISKLTMLTQRFLSPLQKNPPLGTENTLHYLCNNFQRLQDAHEIFYEELQRLSSEGLFPLRSRLGSVVQENIQRLGPIYTTFAKNYQASVETLDYFHKNNAHFNTFLDELGESTNSYKKLKNLLQWPVEHLAALETKLNSIFASYKDIQTDYEKLANAITSIGFYSDLTQTQINQNALPSNISNIMKILQVEWQLEPMEKPLCLLAWSSRKLIKEGPMKIDGKRNMMVYLFSDIVLITEKFEKSLRFGEVVELHRACVAQNSDKDFTLIRDNANEIQCRCVSKVETASWLTQITKIIDNYNAHRVYGVTLAQILAREKEADGIPRVLKQTLFHIAQNATDVEGIFRVPGDSNIISEYKVLYDCGMSKDIDFSMCSSHDVAGLCKLFLRELPEPLIPFELYDKVIETEKNQEVNEDAEQRLLAASKIISEVPKEQRKVLRFVLFFLHEFSANEEHTKMGIANLAMVFSPNLVRPKVDTMDTAMASPMISKFVIFLIRNHEKVWELAHDDLASTKEGNESMQELIHNLLQKEDVNLDEIMKLSSRPSQYIDLSPVKTTKVEPSGNIKSPKRMRYGAKKSPRRDSPARENDSPAHGRHRKKKNSASFNFRRSNTGI